MKLIKSDQDSNIYVQELVPGGPAQLCGNIMVDDVLYKVDSTVVTGMELAQVRRPVYHDFNDLLSPCQTYPRRVSAP